MPIRQEGSERIASYVQGTMIEAVVVVEARNATTSWRVRGMEV